MENINNSCCVFVTYANRFHLLSRVVEEVLRQGVRKVVIIDNGSVEESAAAITGWARNNPSLIVHRFPTNQGSAVGFKKGLEIASQSGCDFIWILDDDNLPANGVLKRLHEDWSREITAIGKEDGLALLCLRKDREEFQRVLHKRTPDAILPARNSFIGFHIREIILKLKERIPSRHRQAIEMPLQNDPIPINAASYGGLFFHRKLLDRNGLPDDSFVLYIDDFDFTYRFTQSGGCILLVPDCVVEDIDQSFYLPTNKKLLYHSTLDTPKDVLAYYMVRNSVYFASRNLATSKSIFLVNKFIFILFISTVAILRGKLKRLKLIYGAISDGARGHMGINPKFKL